MSKVGNKSIEEVCSDCLYNSGLKDTSHYAYLKTKGEVNMHDSKMDETIIPKERMMEEVKEKYCFESVLHDLAYVYNIKNNDYGNSFKDLFDEFGMTSSIIRLSDKLNRLKSLQKNEQKVMDESVIDTLMDCASYCIMTIVELKNK